MQIRSGRAVKTLALGALLTVGVSGLCAAQGTRSKSENSLLGITLLKSSYRDVLKKFGRPNEIQAGGPFLPSEGAPTGAAPKPSGGFGGSSGYPGAMGGGYPGGSSGPAGAGGGGGGKRTISKTGFPGKGGSSAASPASAGGGYPGGGGGYPGSSGGGYPGVSGGLPGFGAPGGSSGYPGGSSGYPGASGGYPGGSSGLPGLPGAAGGPPGASGAPDNGEDAPQYEATWWYHDKKDGLHISFLFNKDGRVIQIQEYGPDVNHKAGKTRLGVTLGSGMNTVLHQYGWSNDGANDGRNVILRFGGEEKVAFQLVNNVVRGITVAVVKETPTTVEPR